MATLTNTATLTIGAAEPEIEEVEVTVIAAPGSATGNGRLVHPTLGTLDYDNTPNEWTNIDGDVIPFPTWASAKTLKGAANTLWRADIRDVTISEKWTNEVSGGLVMRMAMLRTLLAFFLNPPDPAAAWVLWYPTYTTDLSFKVLMTNLTVGGEGITLDTIATKLDWATREVALTLKVVARNE